MKPFAAAVSVVLWTACSSTPSEEASLPPELHVVEPVSLAQPRSASSELTIGQGQFFSYALPQGWRVGEDGQFALTLIAPDNNAATVMVGNAGLPIRYPADRFASEKLSALQPQNLRLGRAVPAKPVNGFSQAFQFEVAYVIRGIPSRGLVKVHIAPAYDTQTMAMTAALTAANQWDAYSSWLPLVADQISATNGGAFGMRGIMAQNLQNSTAYAEAARQYRDWSQKNWQGVVDQRNASQDKNNFAFRENLGAIQTYTNPYDNRVPLELPTTYKHYWINEKGTIAGTDDPGVNPNVGSTSDWKQLPRYQP